MSHKRRRVTEGRAQAVLHNLQSNPAPPANKNIGFISCPASMRLDTEEGMNKLKDAVADFQVIGAGFISMTCGKKRYGHESHPICLDATHRQYDQQYTRQCCTTCTTARRTQLLLYEDFHFIPVKRLRHKLLLQKHRPCGKCADNRILL